MGLTTLTPASMEGWLDKRSDFLQAWNPRYFVLRSSPEPSLQYSRKQQNVEPANILQLQGGSCKSAGSSWTRFRFEVSAAGQTYFLAAKSGQERHDWLEALSQAIAGHNTAKGISQPMAVLASAVAQRASAAQLTGAEQRPQAGQHGPAECSASTPPPLQKLSRSGSTGREVQAALTTKPPARRSSSLGTRLPRPPSPAPTQQPSFQRTSLTGQGSVIPEQATALLPGASPPSSPFMQQRPSLGQRMRSSLGFANVSDTASQQSDAMPDAASEASVSEYDLQLPALPVPATSLALVEAVRGGQPGEMLLEQSLRAEGYVAAHPGLFSDQLQVTLKSWSEVVHSGSSKPDNRIAAAGMYVLEVTKITQDWADWDEHDSAFVSPDSMMEKVRQWPITQRLDHLKDCLNYGSISWTAVFCRLGGVQLLLQALVAHAAAVGDSSSSPAEGAQSAMAAAVSALHALLSGDQGLAAFTQATGAVPQLLLALRPAGCITEDRLPQIFIMQMLLKLCMFSPAAYAVTLHGLLGEEPPERQQPGHVGGQPTDADKLKSTPCSPPSEQHIVSAPEPAAAPRAEWPAAGSMPSNPPPPAPPPPPRLPAGGRAGPPKVPPVPPPPPGRRAPPAAPPLPAKPVRKAPAATVIASISASAGNALSSVPHSQTDSPADKFHAAASIDQVSQADTGASTQSQPAAAPGPPPPPPKPMRRASSSTVATASASGANATNTAAKHALGNAGATAEPPQPVLRSAPLGGISAPHHASAASISRSLSNAVHAASGSVGKGADADAQTSPDRAVAASPQEGCVRHGEQEAARAVAQVPKKSGPEYCQALLDMLLQDDADLNSHVVSFVNVALSSPEASLHAALQKRFAARLLDCGLMRINAELDAVGDPYMQEALQVMKGHIQKLVTPPKPAPKQIRLATKAMHVPPTVAPVPPPLLPKAPPLRPPPPPPPGRGRGRGPPAPPPAAATAGPRTPAGPRPRIKMKAFFWDKLPDSRIPGTFWESHAPAYSLLKPGQIEEQFQASQSRAIGGGSPAGKAAQKLAVLDLKRATAIGIRMSRLRVPWESLGQAIATLDGDAFRSAEDVNTVLACLPTEEERTLLASYEKVGGDTSSLMAAELFCMDLMKIPRVDSRLTTFLARFEAAALLNEARSIAVAHLQAQQQLRGSAALATVLELTLALGNFLNFGTRLGSAAGFRLKNLSKLQDTRAQGVNLSLEKYIAQQLCFRPPCAILSNEMPAVISPALSTSLQGIGELIEKIARSLAGVKLELRRVTKLVTVHVHIHRSGMTLQDEDVSVELVPDRYYDIMSTTLQEAEHEMAGVRALQAEARDGFASLVAFFGENVAAFASDSDFWAGLASFVSSFSTAQSEILKQRQEIEEADHRKRKRHAASLNSPA